MRKSWIAAFTIVAFVTLLIPTTTFFPSSEKKSEPKAISYSATSEHEHKLTTLQNDMRATSLLVTTDITRDLQKMLETPNLSHEVRKNQLQAIIQAHDHLTHIQWIQGKEVMQLGQAPSSEIAAQAMEDGISKVTNGEIYQSNPFEGVDNNQYVVIGTPSTMIDDTGMVALIRLDIVKSVERHQKRNLRLIPYPAEGNYRIESVQANSTSETTVLTGEDNGSASHYHIRDVVVSFEQELNEDKLQKIKKDIDADVIQRIGNTYVFRAATLETNQLIAYFKKEWKPIYVEPHYLYMTNESQAVIPNDALYSQYQWNLPSIETEQGWNISKGDEAVIIAVLDTGVQSNHPDLQGKLLSGMNIINNQYAPDDDVGHGTHVTGIIGASVNNGEGVAGVSWYNKILPVKVLDNSGAGSTYSVAQGIIWAVDNGAKIINMSLGNYAEASFLHDAIKYAYERDVVLIAASGNDNTEKPGYPAAYPEVFAVAATTNNKQKASFSNYGNYIDVAAPGDSIASTYPGSQYAALSGTSMASPHVAALAGLIRSVNTNLTNTEVMEIMRATANDLGTIGKDIYFGHGEIDIDKALNAAANYGESIQTFPQQVKEKLDQLPQ